MANYNDFNSRNYECGNCDSLKYRTMNSGHHGSYNGKEDYSMNRSENFGY